MSKIDDDTIELGFLTAVDATKFAVLATVSYVDVKVGLTCLWQTNAQLVSQHAYDSISAFGSALSEPTVAFPAAAVLATASIAYKAIPKVIVHGTAAALELYGTALKLIL